MSNLSPEANGVAQTGPNMVINVGQCTLHYYQYDGFEPALAVAQNGFAPTIQYVANAGALQAPGEISTDGPEEFITLQDGRQLRWVVYFDTPGHEEMTAAVAQGRAEQYRRAGWLARTEGAGGQTGPNVEVFALVDPVSGEPVASLRLAHSELREAPSYRKANAAGAIDDEGRRILAERVPGRPVAEVGDLWKDEGYPSDVALELYMRAAHASMERGEVWIVGAVGPEVRTLQKLFGPNVVHVLGPRFGVGDSTAKEGVMLTPILIDPMTAVGDLLDWVGQAAIESQAAAALGDHAKARALDEERYYREWVLWRVVDGAPAHCIDDVTARRLGNLRHGRAA